MFTCCRLTREAPSSTPAARHTYAADSSVWAPNAAGYGMDERAHLIKAQRLPQYRPRSTRFRAGST